LNGTGGSSIEQNSGNISFTNNGTLTARTFPKTSGAFTQFHVGDNSSSQTSGNSEGSVLKISAGTGNTGRFALEFNLDRYDSGNIIGFFKNGIRYGSIQNFGFGSGISSGTSYPVIMKINTETSGNTNIGGGYISFNNSANTIYNGLNIEVGTSETNTVTLKGATTTINSASTTLLSTNGTALTLGSSGGTMGLYGIAPVARANTGGAEATITGGGGTSVDVDTLFDGYSISGIVKALRNIGVLT
jgi:hypothetical protein